MHSVAVLVRDGVYPFELGIPARVFGAARHSDGSFLYQVTVCSADGRPVSTNAGFAVSVDHDARALTDADTVVIVPIEFGWPPVYKPPSTQLLQALAGVRTGTRIVSFCNGAYLLAAAGILDGRPATTHWRLAGHFAATFPAVAVRPDVLFVDDGDVLTSAGAAAGTDLCLHLVRRDHGAHIANWVARDCVVPPWREGGQAQFIHHPVPEQTGPATAATRAWVLQRLHQPPSLDEMAAHARMSRRTFTRRFQQEAGTSPGQWILQQRLQLARNLLETSDLPVDAVADQAGFGTAASLRRHMQLAVGISPLTYRRTFRPPNAATGMTGRLRMAEPRTTGP